jgi:transglutaminase-like putative cysteine protease
MKRAAAVALFVFTTAVSAHAAVRVPDWMQAAAAQQLPSYPDKVPGVALLDETTVTVQGTDELRTTRRVVYKILGTAGRDLGVLSISFGGETKLTRMEGWSIAASGMYHVKERDAVESAAFDGELYADYKIKALRVPAAEPGSVVAFEYELTSHPYAMQDLWAFQSTVPVRRARYVLSLPDGWQYETKWMNAAAVEPQRAAGTIAWELADVARVEEEPGAPSLRAVSGTMGLTLVAPTGAGHRTWDDVARWYEGLAEPRRAVSPSIDAKAKALTASLATPYEKIAALARFAQRDVRYVEIAIGIGSHQPHPADAILSTLYGDCKDKVTLLSSMLAAIGVHSHYVLVHTDRGVADDRFPSLYVFNHAIIAIELPAGAPAGLPAFANGMLFFDPTDTFTPLGILPVYLQGSRGLLVPGKGSLVVLPSHGPESNQLVRTAKLKLGADGALDGEVREVRTGALAAHYRAMMSSLSETERRQQIDSMLAWHLDQHSIRDLVIENVDDPSRELVVRYTFSAPHYARTAGGMLLLRPRVVGTKPEGALDLSERKQDYVTEGPSRQLDDVEIAVPANYVADELPPARKLDTPAVVYSSASTFEKNTLHYRRAYEVRQYIVTRDKLAELNKTFAEILADERTSAVFK